VVWTIGRKLSVGFGLCCSVTAVMALLTYRTLSELRDLQDQGAGRAAESSAIAGAKLSGDHLIGLVVDLAVAETPDLTFAEWRRDRDEALAVVHKMAADFPKTDDERKALGKAEAATQELARKIDTEALPLFTRNAPRGEINRELAHLMPFEESLRDTYERAAQLVAADSEARDRDFDATVRAAIRTSTILAFASIFALVFIAVLVTRMVTVPVKSLTLVARALSQGDLSETVTYQSQDEIGLLARAFQATIESQRARAALAEAVAKGDLSRKVVLASDRDQLGSALQTMVQGLRELTTQISSSVSEVANGADEISGASQSVSQGATEQAASLEEISSSIAEVGSQAKGSSENAAMALSLSVAAREAAEAGSQRMQSMVAAMSDIRSSSQQIAKTIKVIDDIAFQTNILALNAAVEAARAGKHGKGFAVVAEEVRNLASRSAQAARETGELIDASGKTVQTGLDVATATAEAFKDIVDNAVGAADLVGKIASASKGQSSGIAQASTALTQIAQVTQSNTAHAEQTAAASQQLAANAQTIKSQLAHFRLGEASCGPATAALHPTPGGGGEHAASDASSGSSLGCSEGCAPSRIAPTHASSPTASMRSSSTGSSGRRSLRS
jgi:methyl-accepting chemotaxis protein